jgi:hypothetical protein
VDVQCHAEPPAHLVRLFGAAGDHEQEFPSHLISEIRGGNKKGSH